MRLKIQEDDIKGRWVVWVRHMSWRGARWYFRASFPSFDEAEQYILGLKSKKLAAKYYDV